MFSACAARFVSDLVGNPEDRFSHNAAQLKSSPRFKTLFSLKGIIIHCVSTDRGGAIQVTLGARLIYLKFTKRETIIQIHKTKTKAFHMKLTKETSYDATTIFYDHIL